LCFFPFLPWRRPPCFPGFWDEGCVWGIAMDERDPEGLSLDFGIPEPDL
jgi:hypothetical protein